MNIYICERDVCVVGGGANFISIAVLLLLFYGSSTPSLSVALAISIYMYFCLIGLRVGKARTLSA